MYHYAGNNPIKYVDPDGRFDIIDDSVSGFRKLFDVASKAGNDNKPIESAKEFSNFMNDNPEFWGVLAGCGAVSFIGYEAYSNNAKIKNTTDKVIEFVKNGNAFLLDKGVDIANAKYTYKENSGFVLSTDISGSSVSISNSSFCFKNDTQITTPISNSSSVKTEISFNTKVYFNEAKRNQSYFNLVNFNISFCKMY